MTVAGALTGDRWMSRPAVARLTVESLLGFQSRPQLAGALASDREVSWRRLERWSMASSARPEASAADGSGAGRICRCCVTLMEGTARRRAQSAVCAEESSSRSSECGDLLNRLLQSPMLSDSTSRAYDGDHVGRVTLEYTSRSGLKQIACELNLMSLGIARDIGTTTS